MSTLRVIYVHGISSSVIKEDYASDLSGMLVEKLTKLGVIPHEADQGDIERIITFERVNYSEIGQAEEERVLKAYNQERNKLFNFLDQLIERAAFDRIRQQIITSVSDVLVYESDFWRTKIRDMLVDKIKPYVRTHDPVTVIGHSLGSVVAFDTVYYNSRHNRDWLEAEFKVANLFTLGSPLALFTLELDDDSGLQKPRYFPAEATPKDLNPTNTNPDLQPVSDKGVWLNFLDAQDLIGYPLQLLFKDKFKLEDILVQTGTDPIKAHSEYWRNNEVATRIAERLKIDYQRVNG